MIVLVIGLLIGIALVVKNIVSLSIEKRELMEKNSELTDKRDELTAELENVNDLDYIEEAEGISRLMRLYGLSQDQAARRLGKSQSAVANKLRLLRHSPAVLEALRTAGLSERHARALLKLPGEQDRLAMVETIVKQDLTVAKTEELIDRQLARRDPPRQGMRKFVMRDVRLFLNSVNHHLETMKNAGIPAACGREETETEIVLTIRLPKRVGGTFSSCTEEKNVIQY